MKSRTAGEWIECGFLFSERRVWTVELEVLKFKGNVSAYTDTLDTSISYRKHTLPLPLRQGGGGQWNYSLLKERLTRGIREIYFEPRGRYKKRPIR